MKTIKLIALLMLITSSVDSIAQETGEKYGRTLNFGVGIGYYGYVGSSMPVLHLNYEFNVARNFTLAPFVSFYSYSRRYYWGNKNYPYKNYRYHVTVVPVGVKGTYYFDNLLGAGSKWDFYLAGSIGFNIVNSTWDDDYYGDRDVYRHASPLYLDGHIGAEYHASNKIGFFLDLSSGVSTIGIAIH